MTTTDTRELLIEHTAENGTTLTGTTKADDVYNLMRSLGWLLRRNHDDYRLQGSVDKPFKRGAVQRTVEALEKHFAGTVTVRVEADRELRSVVDAEASIAEAAEARADRLGGRADRLGALSEAARAAADRVFDAIPFGQPLLVGHHSYKADRNRRERAWNQLGRSYELGREAAKAAAAAEVAGDRMRYRHTPVTVANRIERLSAERRRIERAIGEDDTLRGLSDKGRAVAEQRFGLRVLSDTSREDYADQLAHLIGQIEYWTEVREQQIADGVATNYSRDTVKAGDVVKVRDQWHYVVRANAKTVAVPSPLGGEWTHTTPWHEVQDAVTVGDERHTRFLIKFLATEKATKFGAAAAKKFPDLAAQVEAALAARAAEGK